MNMGHVYFVALVMVVGTGLSVGILTYLAATRATHNAIQSYGRRTAGQFLNELASGKCDGKQEAVDSAPVISPPKPKMLPVDSLVEFLDKSIFPGVAGSLPRGSRRARLDRWRKALASCGNNRDAEILFDALAKSDRAVANGKDGRKVRTALQSWCKK